MLASEVSSGSKVVGDDVVEVAPGPSEAQPGRHLPARATAATWGA